MSFSKNKPALKIISTKKSLLRQQIYRLPQTEDYMIDWINGLGEFIGQLPELHKIPVPEILYELEFPHPDRPRGSSAMLHASGARHHLGNLRAGAWTIAPNSGWHYVKTSHGTVEWIPKHICMPKSLFVPFDKENY